MADRWIELTATTPSGKMLFVCQSCGRKSEIPDAECPQPAMFKGDTETYVPCAVWPMKPDEWLRIERETSVNHIVFSGTITFEDGRIIQVTAPIHEALAKDITVISTELKMKESRTAEAMEHMQRDDKVQELIDLQARVGRLQKLVETEAGAKDQSTADRLRNQTLLNAMDGTQDAVDALADSTGVPKDQMQAAFGRGFDAGAGSTRVLGGGLGGALEAIRSAAGGQSLGPNAHREARESYADQQQEKMREAMSQPKHLSDSELDRFLEQGNPNG